MEGTNLLSEILITFHTVYGGYLDENLVEIHTVYIWVHNISRFYKQYKNILTLDFEHPIALPLMMDYPLEVVQLIRVGLQPL